MAKKEKSKPVVWMEYLPFRALYSVIRGLSLGAGYSLASFCVKILYVFDIRHRGRAVQHLLHAGVAKTPSEARAIAMKMFVEFGKLLVDIIKMDQCYNPSKTHLAGSKKTIQDVFSPDGPRRQVIIVTAHYGNWEVAGTAFSDAAGRPMTSIMRSFDNPLIGEKILAHRASSVHEVVDKSKGIRPLLKALGTGRNISVLIDQHASHLEGVETTFFGHPCRTHKTPALLHLKTEIPIIPLVTRRLPGSNFEFEIEVGDLIEYKATGNKDADISAVTQLCTDALEKLISNQPEQWMWSARRWLDINRHSTPPSMESVPGKI